MSEPVSERRRDKPRAVIFGTLGQALWDMGINAVPAAVLSIGAHVGLWAALGGLPPMDEMLAAAREVRVELVAEPPPPPPEVVEPEPPPEPEIIEPEPPPPEPPPEPPPVRERVREPETTPDPTPAVETPPEEPPPMEERIEDFTGETLSNDSAEGPAIIAGNGEAITGPVGAAIGVTTGRSRRGSPDGAPGGTGTAPEADGVPVMDASDLSRTATPPPDLAALVTRHYPPELRARSVEGEAVVAFVVMPNGILRRLASRSATEEAFAEACLDALRESSGDWGSPLDRSGREVGQRIRFTCRFSLRF